jgi:AhpD family alkylhydroperoxidase
MSTEATNRFAYEAFRAAFSDAHAGLVAAGAAAAKGGLGKDLLELVKIRASQINGCAFCLKLHIDLARAAGVPQLKIDLLPVWRDTTHFSAPERAALAWAERLTHLEDQPEETELLETLADQFADADIQRLTIAIGVINAWNRIAGPLHFALPG